MTDATKHLKYDPKLTPTLARKFAMLGCTNERLAELFEVSIKTIESWMATFPAFKEAVFDGRDIANATVANSLYSKACGYTYEEATWKRIPVYGQEVNDDGSIREILTGFEMVKVRVVEKHIPPDAAAAMHFLSNRTRLKPIEERWTSRQEITGADGAPLVTPEQTDSQAKKARAALLTLIGAE